MWKPEHRRAAERRSLRYPSDLTDTLCRIATALCSSSIGAHAASSPSSSLSSLIPGAVPKKFGDRFVKLRSISGPEKKVYWG